MAECMLGVDVRRVWSERAMVCTFGGHIFPGTPDGMFESWDGTLTCVQVVRVPLVAGMSPEFMQDVLSQILLTKVVKSQQWLRACRVVPHDFVIFCWLPFTIPDSVAEGAELLMSRVRELDSRFSHRLRVPAETGALFPAQFAHVSASRKAVPRKSTSESEVCAFTSTGYESEDEDEEPCWDITWAWDSVDDHAQNYSSECSDVVEGGDQDLALVEEELELEWDITWDWQCGGFATQMKSSADLCTSNQQPEGASSCCQLPVDDGG